MTEPNKPTDIVPTDIVPADTDDDDVPRHIAAYAAMIGVPVTDIIGRDPTDIDD